MKQLKLIIAVLFLMGSVVSATAEKRPAEITFWQLEKSGYTLPNEGLYKIQCHYDTIGRLDSVRFICLCILSGSPEHSNSQHKNFSPNKYDTIPAILTWHENSVTVNGVTPFRHQEYQYTYVLENGRAVERTGEEYAQRFFYNSTGYLTDVIYRYGREDMSLTSFIRENGNVTRVHGQQNSFKTDIFSDYDRWKGGNSSLNIYYDYGESMNPTGIDFLLLETMPYDNQIMILACLDGKHSCQLPTVRKQYFTNNKVTPPQTYEDTHEYSYEVDADGYPVKITIPESLYSGYSCVVELKYGHSADDNNTGSVTGIDGGASDFTITGRTVSTSDEAIIQAYDLQGRLVASSANGTITLPNAGVYILCSGSKTMKAVIK